MMDLNHISHLAKSSGKTFLIEEASWRRKHLIAMTARQTFYVYIVRFLIGVDQSFCSSSNVKKMFPVVSIESRDGCVPLVPPLTVGAQPPAAASPPLSLSSPAPRRLRSACSSSHFLLSSPAGHITTGPAGPGAFQCGCGQIFQPLNVAARLSVSLSRPSASRTRRRRSPTSQLQERLDFSSFDTPVESIRNNWGTASHPPATQLLYRCRRPGHQPRLGSFIYLSPQQLLCLFHLFLLFLLLLRLFPRTAAPPPDAL